MPRRDAPPPPRVLPRGVIVSPGLQITELTLREKRNMYGYDSNRLRRDEAERAGYSKEEIEREFGPEC